MIGRPDVQEEMRAVRADDGVYRGSGPERASAARFVAEAAAVFEGAALDMGTGDGLLAIELARLGLNVVSVDRDADRQALAGLIAQQVGLASRVRFVHGDAARLSFADGSFACVAIMDILHHLDDPVPVLVEATRVLARPGRMVVADFDEEGLELPSRVHTSERRGHPRTLAAVSMAESELARLGLLPIAHMTGHRHEVGVLLKARGSGPCP